MELEDAHGIDLQTERMLHILTVENTNIKLEPELHPDGDATEPSETVNYTDDIDNIVEVKTEVIDNDHYQHMDIHYNHDMCSNSNYIDTGMIRDTHVATIKSEPPDETLETNYQSEFIIEIDRCKDEYYEPHGYPNNHSNLDLGLGESGVEHESGGDCVTKECMHMKVLKHCDTQIARWALDTSVDTKPCTVVVRDIRYTYPDIVTQGSVRVRNREPTIQIHANSKDYAHVLQQPTKKPHVCSFCGVGFTQKSSVKTHMRIHTGDKPHKCSVCGDEFTYKNVLKRHTRMHTGEKPHTCSVCGVSFTQKGTLTSHMRTHTGEKPYICSVCGGDFSDKSTLTCHMRTHTGEKPYLCSVCGVAFAQKSDLTRHTWIHTGEKPYKCSVCNVNFTQKQNLTRHMRTHTCEKPYKCVDCGCCFRVKENLRRHRHIHTGDKPHTCIVCGVGFTQKGDLKRHSRLHTGETPHMCVVCEVGFARKGSLISHMRTHTGEKPYKCEAL